eukprot:465102-Pelagomonas_calceolata.AAC.1
MGMGGRWGCGWRRPHVCAGVGAAIGWADVVGGAIVVGGGGSCAISGPLERLCTQGQVLWGVGGWGRALPVCDNDIMLMMKVSVRKE